MLSPVNQVLKKIALPNREKLPLATFHFAWFIDHYFEFYPVVLNPTAFTWLVEDESIDGHTYGETVPVFPRDFSPGNTITVSLSPTTEDYFDFITNAAGQPV